MILLHRWGSSQNRRSPPNPSIVSENRKGGRTSLAFLLPTWNIAQCKLKLITLAFDNIALTKCQIINYHVFSSGFLAQTCCTSSLSYPTVKILLAIAEMDLHLLSLGFFSTAHRCGLNPLFSSSIRFQISLFLAFLRLFFYLFWSAPAEVVLLLLGPRTHWWCSSPPWRIIGFHKTPRWV